MPQNDFIVFGGQTGANVMSQSSYLALPSRLTGFQTGIASSQQLNKVWRQSSIISAMIAQFICDQTGLDALDDGTIATLEARFIQALGHAARIPLTGDLQLYVSASGNDNNNGLSSSTPFQTLQHAADVAKKNYDSQGFDIYVNVLPGNYPAGVTVSSQLTGGGSLRFVGNPNSPSSVVITLSTVGYCFAATRGAKIYVSGMQLSAPIGGTGPGNTGVCLYAQTGSIINFDHVSFSGAALAHMYAGHGATIFPSDNAQGVPYSIVGSAQNHIFVEAGGSVVVDFMVCTITGSPAFSTAFGEMLSGGFLSSQGTTWSPSPAAATGVRHLIADGGILRSNGTGQLPGNLVGIGGSTAGGGFLV